MADKSLELFRDSENEDVFRIAQAPGMIFLEMQMLNLFILLYITIITVHAQRGYILDGSALKFLIGAGSIPILYWKLPICVAILWTSLLLLLSVPCNNHPELVGKLLLEYGIAVGICVLTGFGYTGIVMLLLADIMRYRIDWHKRIAYIFIMVLVKKCVGNAPMSVWVDIR